MHFFIVIIIIALKSTRTTAQQCTVRNKSDAGYTGNNKDGDVYDDPTTATHLEDIARPAGFISMPRLQASASLTIGRHSANQLELVKSAFNRQHSRGALLA